MLTAAAPTAPPYTESSPPTMAYVTRSMVRPTSHVEGAAKRTKYAHSTPASPPIAPLTTNTISLSRNARTPRLRVPASSAPSARRLRPIRERQRLREIHRQPARQTRAT